MPRKSYLICNFILPRKIDNMRLQKIETFNPPCHAHCSRVNSEDELDDDDDDVSWLKEAYFIG